MYLLMDDINIKGVEVEVSHTAMMVSMAILVELSQTMAKAGNKEATRKMSLYTKVSMAEKEVVKDPDVVKSAQLIISLLLY